MESKLSNSFQLFARIAISVTFLSAVADRFGIWGAPGSPSISWGNWENFLAYSNSVNSFVPASIGNILAIAATALEIIIPLLLLAGYKLRVTAITAGILLVCFGLAMTLSFGIKPSLDYSVWTGAAGCLLLSTLSSYPYSVDNYVAKNR